MNPHLKNAIDAARFHMERGIECPGDANLVAAWEEIVRLEAKTLLMDSIAIPDDAYSFLVAREFDGTLVVCGENAAGESFAKKFKVIPASQAPAAGVISVREDPIGGEDLTFSCEAPFREYGRACRLIDLYCAAPKLLRILEKVEKRIVDGTQLWSNDIQEIRTAIAEAKGED